MSAPWQSEYNRPERKSLDIRMSKLEEPHYRIPAAEFAAWIDAQGDYIWWTVDGDPVLTGRLPFPCPGDELAAELRFINRPLLVLDKSYNTEAKGQEITKERLDDLVGRLGEDAHVSGPQANDRIFFLRWEGSEKDWLLIEDEETSESYREELTAERKSQH